MLSKPTLVYFPMSSTYRPVPSQVPSASSYPPYDKSSPPILAITSSKERTRLVGLKVLGPVFMVVLGLATVLILWLYTHRVFDSPPQTLATVCQTGYFLADEGTEIVNGLQRAKANGLTISAATVRAEYTALSVRGSRTDFALESCHLFYHLCHIGHFCISDRRSVP